MAVALVAVAQDAPRPPQASPARVSQREFKQMLAARKISVVDVRVASTYADGHIPGAILLEYDGNTLAPSAPNATPTTSPWSAPCTLIASWLPGPAGTYTATTAAAAAVPTP